MLTDNERTFFSRVAIHMVEHNLDPAGQGNIEAACRSVLARDEALWLAVATKTSEGQAIAAALCEATYKKARKSP